jgi:hypothetical protein
MAEKPVGVGMEIIHRGWETMKFRRLDLHAELLGKVEK